MNGVVFHRGKHLNETEIYDAHRSCPVCLSSGPRRAVVRLQARPDVHLLECQRCLACSASHMPHQEVLSNYYSSYYADGSQQMACTNVDRLARHICGYVSAVGLGPTIRILDFGGGDGTLAHRVAGRLFRKGVAAVEIDVVDYVAAATVADERITLRSYRSIDDLPGGLYEMVVASAVLEHIPSANAVMRRLFSLVRPGGYFYARTPYLVPLARLIHGLDLTYPGHVHDMGPAFWSGVPTTFGIGATILASRPSPIETTLQSHPSRTLAAGLMKVPGWLESALVPAKQRWRLWRLVGGWEVVLKFED